MLRRHIKQERGRKRMMEGLEWLSYRRRDIREGLPEGVTFVGSRKMRRSLAQNDSTQREQHMQRSRGHCGWCRARGWLKMSQDWGTQAGSGRTGRGKAVSIVFCVCREVFGGI